MQRPVPDNDPFIIGARVRHRDDWSMRGAILDNSRTDHLCKSDEVLVRYIGQRADTYVKKNQLDVI